MKKSRIYKYAAVSVVILAILIYAVTHVRIIMTEGNGLQASSLQHKSPPKVKKGMDELPKPADFETVAQNSDITLMADPTTGHFIVKDNRDGAVYRSYPDPQQWKDTSIMGAWRSHLRAPLMFEYKNFSDHQSQTMDSDFIYQHGKIENFKKIKNGFSLTFDVPSIGIKVPVQVTANNNYVQTKIINSGITEKKPVLMWLRLYPFFGAEHTGNASGYMFIPDGSGTLIQFQNSNSQTSNQIYDEPIYGQDQSFAMSVPNHSTQRVVMPVFGIHYGNKGFLAVDVQGAGHTEILGSPAGVYSKYNWAAFQQNYRAGFKEYPNRHDTKNSFVAYNVKQRFGDDRTVRYYFLDNGHSNYVGMAQQYRQYLINRYHLSKIKPKNALPLDLSIIGAGTESGAIRNKSAVETTTSQAMQMIQRLYGLGIQNMSIQYWGWQHKGYSAFGNYSSVNPALGGNGGMKKFVQYAHSMHIPVYLNVNYSVNNTGSDGYIPRYDAMRNQGGTLLVMPDVLKRGGLPMVSEKFMMKQIKKDLPFYKKLGVNGLDMMGIGNDLNSDYNSTYGANRQASKKLQQQLLTMVKDTLGGVQAEQSNIYNVGSLNQINNLTHDDSYHFYTTDSVPFVQIALHGLVAYNSNFENNRQDFINGFLKDIEYGDNPSYIVTAGSSTKLKYTYGLDYYSTKFSDWSSDMVKEYQRYNKALAGVQDQFIVGHKVLTNQVHETDYQNGERIIVNYSSKPYTADQVTVKPKDFVVLKGGSQQ